MDSKVVQAKEAAMAEYLKACVGGKIPAKAPAGRVRGGRRKEMAGGRRCVRGWRWQEGGRWRESDWKD